MNQERKQTKKENKIILLNKEIIPSPKHMAYGIKNLYSNTVMELILGHSLVKY